MTENEYLRYEMNKDEMDKWEEFICKTEMFEMII